MIPKSSDGLSSLTENNMRHEDKLGAADEKLLDDFRAEIIDRALEIDPMGERDWFDLAYGYFLGLHKTPDSAYDLALELQKRNML